MTDYKAPLNEMQFVLYDVFQAPYWWQQMPKMVELEVDLANAILQEGAKIVEQDFFPTNRQGDEQGCRLEGGQVYTPDGFKAAFQSLVEGGWLGLGGDPDYGGQGMPKVLTGLLEEMMFSANTALTLYATLSMGAALALSKHATDAQKKLYLTRLYSGEWAGSMCLTEPHCGSDLGILRTKAEHQADDRYVITGSKIFITSGDHDLANNVIHLVLARMVGAPQGSRGLSMFLVPKFLVDEAGKLGARNAVEVGSIEHKMGIKGSATCVLNFDQAVGWLVGEPHHGLAAMFTMMNYERLSIGVQGQGTMEMAYQHARDYAKQRLQGRAPRGAQQPDQIADPIIVHPDVRRMLLTIKAFNEGGRAFAVYTGMQLDLAEYGQSPALQQRAQQLVALLTPIAKAFMTDRGLEASLLAQQVLGGHGYVREWGVEQLVRDVRIAQIYEGTNGIQAMDLISRKIYKSRGYLIQPLLEDIDALLAEVKSSLVLQSMKASLEQARCMLEDMTHWLVSEADRNPNILGACAVEYLEFMGFIIVAFMWLKMAHVAIQLKGEAQREFGLTKLATAQFYFEKLLPRALGLGQSIQMGSQATMQLTADQF